MSQLNVLEKAKKHTTYCKHLKETAIIFLKILLFVYDKRKNPDNMLPSFQAYGCESWQFQSLNKKIKAFEFKHYRKV